MIICFLFDFYVFFMKILDYSVVFNLYVKNNFLKCYIYVIYEILCINI